MGNHATIWAPRSPLRRSFITFPTIKLFGLIGIAQNHLRMHLQIPEGNLVRFASVKLLRHVRFERESTAQSRVTSGRGSLLRFAYVWLLHHVMFVQKSTAHPRVTSGRGSLRNRVLRIYIPNLAALPIGDSPWDWMPLRVYFRYIYIYTHTHSESFISEFYYQKNFHKPFVLSYWPTVHTWNILYIF
jgi:hypothetical protein